LPLRWRRSTGVLRVVAVAMLAMPGCETVRFGAPVSTLSAAEIRTIDRLFAAYDSPDVPGAALVVIEHGRVALRRAWGLADLEHRTPVTERTNFRLASLTKAFTAMGIMLLVNDGRLGLEERARDVLPDLPAYAREISIRHLLTHTSGLRAYQDLLDASATRRVTDRDVLGLLHRTDSLLFPAGSAFRYGDTGYAVLARVVETVSGQSFARFLHDRIFARIGMTSTVAWEPGVSVVPDRALGYAETPAGYRLADQSLTSGVLGDGGVYSSVHDLIAWDRALDDGVFLGPRLQALVWSPALLTDGRKTHYGFGWFIDRDAAGLRAFHRGDTTGFSHYIVKYLDPGLTIVILTNRRGGAVEDIAATLATRASARAGGSRIVATRPREDVP
jgi:CubicO group peptidase (beta-lactamase class C family)